MSNLLTERSLSVSVKADSVCLLQQLETKVLAQLMAGEIPIRIAVTESRPGEWYCDVGVYHGSSMPHSIFDFRKRTHEDTSAFNVVMLVPTGIGAEIGGHAGDASPTAALLATVCDTLITHPNVLNASDIIHVPPNALYVEGSVVSRLMMGTVGLRRSRSNRVMVVIQDHEDKLLRSSAYNAVNAARASYGLQVSRAIGIDPSFRMAGKHTASGAAAGEVEGLERLWEILDRYSGEYDAVRNKLDN